MPMAAEPASPRDRALPKQLPVVADSFARDTIISWFRGEFAASNAIIDALCGHLAQLGGSEYEAVFAAIHRRRLNWIPVLQMQKYHSIADVTVELRKVAERKVGGEDGDMKKGDDLEEVKSGGGCLDEKEKIAEKVMDNEGNNEVDGEDDSPDSDITDSGSHEGQGTAEMIDICSNHDDCTARPSQVKMTKGFTAKEHVKGHMVNVVKGLKLYEDVFTDSELARLRDFVNELRAAGQNGEISGDTYILFNKQMKGNKRELIQLGLPIFGHIREEPAGDEQTDNNLHPIPPLLQSVIDHLVQWQLIPEYKKPNGCIISFFDEGEYSQPFLKPPHLDQPISTLLLSESTMAFGRILMGDNDGNYKGPLTLSLKEGSLLVMRGNSADMARHVMCPSPSKRVSITFFKIRSESNHGQQPMATAQPGAMALWQPAAYAMPNGTLNGYEAVDMTPKWGVLHAPVVMLAPVRPMVVSPRKLPQGGTGVFLPWTVGSRKPAKHLPPRAQKGRLLALPSSAEKHASESTSDPGIDFDGKLP